MHLGVQIYQYAPLTQPGPLATALAAAAQGAEAAGFHSFWLPDHFFQVPTFGQPEDAMLEAWTTLAFIAGHTQRLRLGTMVTGVSYRAPGLLVKMATTLDVLTQGRSYFGIGAAWYEEEHRGLGIPFPPTAERFERLEETLQIAQQMWAGDEHPYLGKHYHLARPLNFPQAIQHPHPPIVIGGSGEKKTLRLVAQYADACNFFAFPGELKQIAHKLHVLRGHCEAVGRPFAAIEKTVSTVMPQLSADGRAGTITPQAMLDFLHELAALGIEHVILPMPADAGNEGAFDLFATTVIPQATAMVSAPPAT